GEGGRRETGGQGGRRHHGKEQVANPQGEYLVRHARRRPAPSVGGRGVPPARCRRLTFRTDRNEHESESRAFASRHLQPPQPWPMPPPQPPPIPPPQPPMPPQP